MRLTDLNTRVQMLRPYGRRSLVAIPLLSLREAHPAGQEALSAETCAGGEYNAGERQTS